MAIYKMDPTTGIETVSGAISRRRFPDGTVEAWIMTKNGRMYHRIYRRKSAITPKQSSQRALFAAVAAEIKRLRQTGDLRPHRELFRAVYDELKCTGNVGSVSEASRGHFGGKS